jgi:UDP-N-acetylglucosamine:LPS N-acetylglucosamine transferase
MNENKKTVLIILGSGGHTSQLLNLVSQMGERYNYEYLISEKDRISESKIKIKGRVFKMQSPREMEDISKFIVAKKLFKTAVQSVKVLFLTRAKYIISAGPGLSIPISILGKMFFRKRIIFIESWSRVYSKSQTGKFLYPISDLSFVQWPEQTQKNYPKAIYAGRLG